MRTEALNTTLIGVGVGDAWVAAYYPGVAMWCVALTAVVVMVVVGVNGR